MSGIWHWGALELAFFEMMWMLLLRYGQIYCQVPLQGWGKVLTVSCLQLQVGEYLSSLRKVLKVSHGCQVALHWIHKPHCSQNWTPAEDPPLGFSFLWFSLTSCQIAGCINNARVHLHLVAPTENIA